MIRNMLNHNDLQMAFLYAYGQAGEIAFWVPSDVLADTEDW
jgi:hypothetical protein